MVHFVEISIGKHWWKVGGSATESSKMEDQAGQYTGQVTKVDIL